MTVDTILNEFSARVKALGEEVGRRSELSVSDLVRLVLPVVREVAGLLLVWLGELASRYDRAACPICAGPMRRWGHRPRTVMTWYGPVKLSVPRLRCGDCNQETSPLLARSNLRCGCTPEVWTEVVEEAARQPYRLVEKRLARFGIEVSDSTIEALVNEVGGELSAHEAVAAEAAAELRFCPRSERSPGRLYVSVDARSVRVNGEWREVKVAAFGETPVCGPDAKGQPPPLQRVGSLSYFGGAEEFLKRVYVELVRRGLWQAQEVVLVADGARWIWERLPELVPLGTKKVEILDFYHAAENLQKAVRAVYGEGSEAGRRQFEELRGKLRRGLVSTVLAQLQAWHGEVVAEDARHDLQKVLGYFREHRGRMSYLSFAVEGYQLGSGVVESQCKRLGQRIKGPGMNWSPDGLAALLALDNHTQRSATLPLSEAA